MKHFLMQNSGPLALLGLRSNRQRQHRRCHHRQPGHQEAEFIHIPGDNTADAATDINDINTDDTEHAPVQINHLRQMIMKLIILEAEWQLTYDDPADLRMEDLLALRRELLSSAAPRTA
jgi:hypothetical protein